MKEVIGIAPPQPYLEAYLRMWHSIFDYLPGEKVEWVKVDIPKGIPSSDKYLRVALPSPGQAAAWHDIGDFLPSPQFWMQYITLERHIWQVFGRDRSLWFAHKDEKTIYWGM